jgi:hypothetical protein
MRFVTDFPLSNTSFHDRYRMIDEARIIEALLFAGWLYELGDADSARQARQALQDWVECGLAFRTSLSGERLFDPAEVWAVMKQLARDGRDPHFRRRQMQTWRRFVSDFADSTASLGPFAVEFRRTFNLTGVTAGRTLRLRLPVPLERAHEYRSVTLAPEIAGSATVHANRIELRCVAHEAAVTLAAGLDFSAPSSATPDEDKAIYLRSREGLIVVSDRVRELAGKLAGPGSSVAQAVRAFWTYLIEAFTCAPIHYDQVDAAAPCDRVLDTGLYDCQLGAALFAALCRARDIPARLVGGHFLYRRAPTNHFWAEYWCPGDGWIPVDFIGWDLSCGGDDPAWRDRFFGRLDARLITQSLPNDFTGAPGGPVPPAWHLLQTAAGDGVDIALTALDGRPVYSDFVRMLDRRSV